MRTAPSRRELTYSDIQVLVQRRMNYYTQLGTG